MKKVEELFKNKKLVMTISIIMALIVVSIITLILLNPNKEESKVDEPIKNTTPIENQEEKQIGLTFMKNEDCASYIQKLDKKDYETIKNTEYSSSLYKYNSDENYEYYLVCLSDIKYNDKDLIESIKNNDLTNKELDNILNEKEVGFLKVVRNIKETDESEVTEKNDKEDEKEISSSSNKKPSSTTSSNDSNKNTSSSSSNSSNSNNSSSNNKPSSGSTTSSKEKDNATLKKQLAASGLSWDFNTKSEAEAFKTKWANRGFYAGYYINQYGDSDIAYSGYVEARPSGNCGTSEIFKVDWKNETSNMNYIWDYMQSLGYDCGW